jgi:hypothetical protein
MAKRRTTITSWLKCGGLALALDFIGSDFMTEDCTYWLKIDHDDWSGVTTFANPVTVKCWYKRDNKMVRNAMGAEVVSAGAFFSDQLGAVGASDYIKSGVSTEIFPIDAGAMEVIATGQIPGVPVDSTDLYKVFV